MPVKKNDSERSLAELVDGLVDDVKADRSRVTDFLDNLISEYSDSPGGIAEHVAKLADALTRQHQVTANVIKSLAKRPDEDSSPSETEFAVEIGLPFKDELEDGSN